MQLFAPASYYFLLVCYGSSIEFYLHLPSADIQGVYFWLEYRSLAIADNFLLFCRENLAVQISKFPMRAVGRRGLI